jgi:hypothetical protein
VWIFFIFGMSVMFTVDRNPFFCDLGGGSPQPKSKKMTNYWMQVNGAMSLTAV